MNRLLFVVIFIVAGCTAGPGAHDSKYKSFSLICLEGHAYWAVGTAELNDYAFAPKLDDDGKPSKCEY